MSIVLRLLRPLRPLRRPLLRLMFRLSPPESDHWEPVRVKIPHRVFGAGSVRRFSWYFEGQSVVELASVQEICDWLRVCEYVRDPDLFHEPDYWQHPKTFEQLQRGDCEDHALWAWRKLVELGVDAHFVVGRWRQHDSADPGMHAWIVYEEHGTKYLVETVAKGTGEMVHELSEVREMYSPHFSIDRRYQSLAYVGYLHELHREVGSTSDGQAA